MSAHTRVHTYVTFADPYLRCDQCGQPVPKWHNADLCGCDSGWWNEPCGHEGGVSSICPSWSPVDGCRCLKQLGAVEHFPAAS
jgi:hypothetical protein